MELPKVIGKIELPEPKIVDVCSYCGRAHSSDVRLLYKSSGWICEDCDDNQLEEYWEEQAQAQQRHQDGLNTTRDYNKWIGLDI